MVSYTGHTDTGFTTPKKNLPFILENFSIVNVNGGYVDVNVYKIINNTSLYSLIPSNKRIGLGESYESTRQICVLATEQISLSTTGPVDYDFNFKNMTFDGNSTH